MSVIATKPLFALGSLLITPGALRLFSNPPYEASQIIDRHLSGDWGDLEEDDIEANVYAYQNDQRIFSKYHVEGKAIYVITEADRSTTTILLPSEY